MSEVWQHGSDMLLQIGQKDTGHSSSCQWKRSAETKSRATKDQSGGGLWDAPYVSKQKVTVTTDGFVVYGSGDTRIEHQALVAAYYAHQPVSVTYHRRDQATEGIESGQFIITAIDDSAPVDGDTTYSLTLESCGIISFTPIGASDSGSGA